MSFFSDIIHEARSLAQALSESVGTPVVRLGVTGLSRAGKTVRSVSCRHATSPIAASSAALSSRPDRRRTSGMV